MGGKKKQSKSKSKNNLSSPITSVQSLDGSLSSNPRVWDLSVAPSERDTEEFVQYLLQGVNDVKVDFEALKNELLKDENEPSRSSVSRLGVSEDELSPAKPISDNTQGEPKQDPVPLNLNDTVNADPDRSITPTRLAQTKESKQTETVNQENSQIKDLERDILARDETITTLNGALTRALEELSAAKKDLEDRQAIELDRNELERVKAETTKMSADLSALRQREEQLEAHVQNIENELSKSSRAESQLRTELQLMMDQKEKERQRTDRVFAAVKEKFLRSRAGADITTPMERVLYEVIAGYETKLARDALKSNSNSDPESQQEMNLLRTELEEAHVALDKMTKEKEILKLQLATTKRQPFSPAQANRSLSTRDMIRKDKKDWSLQYRTVEDMDELFAKEALKVICSRLSVSDASKLPNALDKIESVLKLVPQMEEFIRNVDQSIRTSQIKSIEKPLKLQDMLETIQSWANSSALQTDTQKTTEFLTELHEVLGISERLGSLPLCLKSVQDLINGTGHKANQQAPSDIAQQAVRQFQDLFEIRSPSAVLPRMNELYVFWAEVNAGLVKLRDVLHLDSNVQPGRVLLHVTDALQNGGTLNVSSSQISDNIANSFAQNTTFRTPATSISRTTRSYTESPQLVDTPKTVGDTPANHTVTREQFFTPESDNIADSFAHETESFEIGEMEDTSSSTISKLAARSFSNAKSDAQKLKKMAKKGKDNKKKGVENADAFKRMQFLVQASHYMSMMHLQVGENSSSDDITINDKRSTESQIMDDASPEPNNFNSSQSKDRIHVPLSSLYGRHAKQVAKKVVLRMSPHIKRSFCKRCESFLVPGITSSHQLIQSSESKQVYMESHCHVCHSARRILATPKPLAHDHPDTEKIPI